MIHEVDVALRSLIEREATDGTEVEVVFDAPTKDWASRRNVPTIDVYLYDIREDLRRRERGLINQYDGDRVTTRHLPPRHFKLSYLVTAWTQRPEDEHRLLSALLSCFLRHDAIPPDLITGPLAELGLPVPMTIALPPPEDRSFADVWSALGGELKPSLDIVISAPADTGQQYAAGPPVTKPGVISFGGVGAWPPTEAKEQNDSATRNRLSGDGPDRTDGTNGSGQGGRSRGGSAGRSGSTSGGASTGGIGTATVTETSGMSWREFAGSGSRTTAATATEATAPDPGGQGASGTPAKPKPPTRRRRQGGISEK